MNGLKSKLMCPNEDLPYEDSCGIFDVVFKLIQKFPNDLVNAISCLDPLWIYGVMVHKTILGSPR